MERINRIIRATFSVIIIPFAVVAAQDKVNEQRIKIVLAEDNGSKVILDTLITGNSVNDSIVLKNGNTIYLEKTASEDITGTPGCKKYIITASLPDGNETRRQINKEITIISSDSDIVDEKGKNKSKQANCESLANEMKYSYTVESGNMDADSEKAKYVISRDGIVITVEGSDYAKVKEIIKDIEKSLDAKSEIK